MAEQQPSEASTTLTPTARLARAEKRRLAETRLAEGAQAWRAPEVLSFSAWLGKLRGEALMAGALDRVPVSASQARLLWQQVIDTDVFVGEPRVHALAEQAWRTIHEYGLEHPRDWPGPLLSEDSRQFRGWVARFEQLCEQHAVIDEWRFAAELPALISKGQLALPARIELNGFELPPTPLQVSIFDALESAGVEIGGLEQSRSDTPPEITGMALHTFVEPDDELRAAAEWARKRVEADPEASVAIVVPDLSGRLTSVERIFRQVFDPPGFALAENSGKHGTEPWHISLGLPLAQWSLVADALLLLGLDPARIDQPTAGRVLGSPYMAGAETEADRRAGTTANLMHWSPFEITGFELDGRVQKSRGQYAWRADRVLARTAQRTPGNGLAVRMDKALPERARDPGLRPRTRAGFARVPGAAALARFIGRIRRTGRGRRLADRRGAALSLLSERASNATFRERNPGCPVEILGVEEALGSRFDALWITTLDADTWPGAARRDPLLPGPVQADVPTASSDGKLSARGWNWPAWRARQRRCSAASRPGATTSSAGAANCCPNPKSSRRRCRNCQRPSSSNASKTISTRRCSPIPRSAAARACSATSRPARSAPSRCGGWVHANS